jgi:UDP-glucose 6-dehydrogenase
MKRIGIIGLGNVGRAVRAAFSKNGNEIVTYDIAEQTATLGDILQTDFVFICVPTEIDGELNSNIVFEYLQYLDGWAYEGVVIIKSTLLFADRHIEAEFPSLNIVYNPEFLTERNADRDILDPDQVVLGGELFYTNIVKELYINNSYLRRVWAVELTVGEAIAYKLFLNTYLATKVSLVNEFKGMFERVSDRPWNEFARMMSQDSRFGKTHIYSPGWDGKEGYGGKCLPPCAKEVVLFACQQDLPHSTINGGVETNRILRRNES